jgi:putative heme-binding domain-containing protein
MPRATVLISSLIFVATALAQRDAKIPDPDPEVERKSFQVADGFEVNLFAADPMLAKPLQMNFDPAGRLWVATSETYPQIKPGAKANDKIIILEDTKGVGRADKTTVFMDGLLIPTGIEPGDGGVYVANSTELLHVSEKNGKADKVRVLLSGFGTEDTHHILHTLRWGHDGMLYMNQSIYIHSHIETPYGPRRLNAGGIWQYRPETQQLEIFARGWINSWGHHFDRYGQSFVTDGAGGEGINWVVPGGYYPTAIGPHAARTLHGLNPGHPKYCGCEIVSGRHLPDDWQGNVLTNDFRGNRVCRFALKEDGAGFAAVQMPDLIRSTHPAFRPIDIKMGPDGAIYIADWYNPIIQHGEVDFRDPRRDVTHGRIWRVTAKGRKLVERPKLVGAKVEELLEHLKDPEEWTRRMVKRVLKERGAKEVPPKLVEWIMKELNQTDDRSPDISRRLLEAMWVFESFGSIENASLQNHPEHAVLHGLLQVKLPEVRAYAARLLGNSEIEDASKEKLLENACIDLHPRVRLEAVRALGRLGTVTAVQHAMRALERPVDQWLDYALWLTARELEPVWMPALKRGEMPFDNVKHLIFALQAVDSRDTVPTLVNLLKSGKVKKEQEVDVLALLAAAGGPNELALVFERALADEPTRAKLLDALEESARQRKVQPTGDLTRLGALLDPKREDLTKPGTKLGIQDDATRLAAAKLAGAWKLERLTSKLHDVMIWDSAVSVREAAINSIGDMGGPAAKIILGNEARQSMNPAIKRMAIVALTNVDAELSAKFAAEFLTSLPAAEDVGAAVGAFVTRKNGAVVLAKALEGKKLSADVAKVALRTMRASGRETQALTEALMKAGNLTAVRHVLSADEMKQLVEDVRKLGDAVRGEAVYRRKDMACQKCHAIAGAGGLVGPDLISIGASAQIDYLIDSLLLPNKQVKENYNSIRVDLKNGQQVTGIKIRETPKELVLRDGEDREVVIPTDKIDDKTIGGSIMPEGLVDPLTRQELLDLTRFMSELGKVGGPFAVSNARLVRRWQVLEPTKEAYTPLIRQGLQTPAVGNAAFTWSPAYSTVAGILPPDTLPRFELKRGLENASLFTSFVRFQLEVTTPGKVGLKLNGANGLTAWLNGSAADVKEANELDLASGVHTITLSIDWSKRKDGLRVELEDVSGSPARAKIVGGK